MYDLSEACRSTSSVIIEHQSANYELCFSSKERFFRLVVDLNKAIIAAFITHLVRHPEKAKLNGETTMYCCPDSSKSF